MSAARSYTIAELAKALGAEVAGDESLRVKALRHPADAGPDDLAMAGSAAFVECLPEGQARAAILPAGIDCASLGLAAALYPVRARYALAALTAVFAEPHAPEPGIHPGTVVEEGARIGVEPRIAPFVHIAAGAQVGARACIGSHVSIGTGARIGDDVLIHPGVRIGAGAVIGDRAILHQNAVIGADGFSFVTPQPGAVEAAEASGGNSVTALNRGIVRIHSLAAVTLGDDVEIGAGATLDRGTLRDTRVGNGTKIDNLVQIGHNVDVGADCMICAQVGIAGSAQIGDRVVLAGKVGVADHVIIGSDVLVAAGSAVASKIPSRSIYMGYPAVPRDEAIRSVMAIKRLPRLIDAVAALKKRVAAMDTSG